MYEEYNPLEIPCDWNIARKHALARRTGPDTKDEDQEQKPEACPCCGFEIERSQIAFCDNPKELKFLGAGFPLFYNYLKFCILLLGLQSIVGILNMYGNYLGTYCSTEIYNEESKQLELPCQQSILLQLSLANKINNEYAIQLIQKCNLLLIFIVMILLVLFRREQKKLDTQIDESQLTPSDYTIVVKNIPKTLPVNYRWELVNMFQNFALQDSNFQIKVTKVVLVYDTTELQQIEEKIAELIYKKKQTLIRTKMNFQANELQEINLEIKSLENKQEEVENEYFYTNKRFAGIAFVSFESEDMKDKILEHNKDTILERIQSYFYHGKLPNIQEDQLQWHQQKIFVEQAPEPNDVDWEFIHCVTTDKIFARIKAIVLCLLLQAGTFTIIYLISFHLIKLTDQLHEESLEGKIDQEKVMHARFFSFGINLSIVLFNKFSVGYILHMVTDLEKISTKTKFQISFARKLTFSLFMNAALISYIIDILIFKNVYGFGGFIFNETLIFVLNALLPPFIWFVDPWTLIKNYKRDREIEKGTDCLLTQQEANQLMEQVDYQSAKRYADIIKTMWFTFFFGTAIPLGIFSSFFGLMLYYLVDKYNLIRRRTVKESISKELSLEMISLLDLIVIFGPLGCLTVSFSFYGSFEYLDLLQLMFALIFILIPFDSCIDALFPIKNLEEPISYEEGSIDFDTDYDRENPITKKKAIKEFQMDLQIKHQQQLDLKKSREQELNNHDQSYIPDKFR